MKNPLQILFTCFIISLVVSNLNAQTGPGGVGGHELDITPGSPINALWLRAHDLGFSNGEYVSTWNDVSGYNHTAVPAKQTNAGLYFQTDKENGHPWVHFNGTNYLKVANHEVLDGGEGFGIFAIAKRDPLVAQKYENHNYVLAKRAHWNAWSHTASIPMEAGEGGLNHAYELRWDRIRSVVDDEFYPDTMALTAFMNGNLPDGAGSVVQPKKEETIDIEKSYLISYCYSNHEESVGAFVRVNGSLSTRSTSRQNPNPNRVGPVVQSTKDLYLGAAEYDPPGAFGEGSDREDCPTCAETGILEGALSEVIIYKGTLWPTHVTIIENYLALKYDLPLEEDAQYYYDEVYVHDLVGIGNEEGDDKKHSRSISHALTIEEWNESLNAPKNYLFAAHDGLSYEWTSDGLENNNLQRWGRTWRLHKMEEMDVNLSFNFLQAELNLITSQVPNYKIAYKENPEDNFEVITDITATRQLRTLTFNVPNDVLKSGYYTIVYGTGEGTNIAIDENFIKSLQIFPSPAQSDVNISFANYHKGDVTIRFTDITGREVSKINDFKSEDHFKRNISIEHLQRGVYIVEVFIDGKKGVKRIIKQ